MSISREGAHVKGWLGERGGRAGDLVSHGGGVPLASFFLQLTPHLQHKEHF